MAPYLLFGFVVAGVLSIFISAEWVERHLGGRGLSPVWKAALLGVPLPLCSCGVIPVAASMRRHGASRAAVTAFLHFHAADRRGQHRGHLRPAGAGLRRLSARGRA